MSGRNIKRTRYTLRADRLRKRARYKLDDLLRHQHFKCLDCGQRIKNVKRVPVEDRICLDQAKGLVTYLSKEGQMVTVLMASIDHVRRISAGGGNRDNLEVVCVPCHRRREGMKDYSKTKPYFK